MVDGLGFKVDGLWYVVHGLWFMYGLCMVYCLRFMVYTVC